MPTTCKKSTIQVEEVATGHPANHVRLRRGQCTWAPVLLFLGGFLGSAASLHGQTGGGLSAKSFMNKSPFYLPVSFDERLRPTLKEVQLYIKDSPEKPWALKEKVPPTQSFFTIRPVQDGEYWFTVVTVDQEGHSNPPDLSSAAPGLVVVLDTQLPRVDIALGSTTLEGQGVQCAVRDANLDPLKTKFYFQTADKVWRSLEPMPGQPENFCIPAQALHTGLVQVQAADLAGNVTKREINITSLTKVASPGAAPLLPMEIDTLNKFVVSGQGEPGPSVSMEKIKISKDEVVEVQPIFAADRPGHVVSKPIQQGLPPTSGSIKNPAISTGLDSFQKKSEPGELRLSGLSPVQAPTMPVEASKFPGTQVKREVLLPVRQVVNNTHLQLEYQIEQMGLSGVGKVEIYLTRDKGQTWQRYGEDADRKSPAEIDLPGEGLFGITMVVSNGRGFGASPPQSGDAPDFCVEVDVTKPVAELQGVRPEIQGDNASLVITWTARDQNLVAEPIDLYYSVMPEGPWQPIAKGLKNTGQFRWTTPKDLGHVYLRLAVQDAAGNTTQVDTPRAIALDDLSRPRARVTLVTPTITIQGLTPQGH